MLLLAGAVHSSAQEEDEAYDTTIIDTAIAPSIVDSAPKEDTAQNFFTPKEYINQPYSNTKIGSRIPADTMVNDLKNDDAFWYVKSIEKLQSSPQKVFYTKAQRDSIAKARKERQETEAFPDESFSLNLPPWTGILIWTIIIGVFLFAVGYFLLANKINILSRSSSGNSNSMETGEEEVDIFKIPYQELLQKAYAEKNYRLAVRILYLQTLKLLSEKNIIVFQGDYTNMDYLQQLSQTMFYKDFFAITRHYEYAWYGGFTVSEPAFQTIRADFNTIQDKILHR